MSKEIKNKIVPRLRFHEFRDSGAWEEKMLKSVCKMQAGKFVSASEISEIKNDALFPCFGGNGLRGHTKSFTHIGRYSLIGRQGALCGNVTLADGKFHATEHAVVATPENGVDRIWLFYMLTHMNLNQYATGQAQPGLSVDNLEKLQIIISSIEKEQQKIADCLSSLDELITAQNQQLEALKAHKKGLMQQLFPAEGETVPQLRFGEFRDSGEWEEDALGEKSIAFFVNEKMSLDGLELAYYVSTENLLPNYQGKSLSSKLPLSGSATRFKRKDILLSNIRPYLKKVWLAINDGGASNDVIVIRADSKIDAQFLSFLLKNDDFINYIMKGAEGVKMPRGDKDLIKLYRVTFPKKEEQQKIASCFSSLDELITAQTEKIAALKLHKKGLMQGLFPAANSYK